MQIDRRPWFWECNTTGGDDVPFGYNGDYVKDPAGWVHKTFDYAEANGFQVVMLGLPRGFDRAYASYQASPIFAPDAGGQAARAAFINRAAGRKSRGLGSGVYFGRILPDRADISLFGAGRGMTLRFLSDELLPLVEAGCTHVGVDASAYTEETAESLVTLHEAGAAIGLHVVGEAFPLKQVGSLFVLQSAWIHRAPWLCNMPFWNQFNPNQAWGVLAGNSEMRYRHEDWPQLSEAVSIARVHAARAKGFVVDLAAQARPAVVASVLAA